MHTHFDDADWKAVAARYKRSVALPDDRLVDGLDSIRTKFSGNDDYEPSTGGPTFEEIVKQSQASTGFRSVTDDPDANDCTGLREAIISGRWSVVQVVEAFLAKAALAQQVLGCYTEVYFDRARQRAIKLDEELSKAKNKSSLGLLFGVPVSVKAHLAYQGSGSDRGFIFDVLDPTSVEKLLQKAQAQNSPTIPKSTLALLHKQGPHLMQKDGQMIGVLLSEGAVIIGKTTMPQSIMHLDTRSNLHGQTLNPHNLHLSPGGSSGGEAASVASGATLAGLGTDIGGSVRQPAACVGLFGMRPTIGRFSSVGTRSTMPGNEGVIGTAGPFARSLRDLELLMSVLVKGTTESDPYLCPPLPWRGVQDVTQKKLRVGVMRHDGFVKPMTPIRRALSSVEQRLSGNPAIQLVYIDAKDLGERAWKLVRELYFMEDGALIKALASLTGEPLLKLTKYVLQSPVRDHTAGEAWELQYARESFKREAWRTLFYQNDPQQPLDVLLCPSSALVAPRPQHMPYWGYTSLFNLIDLPGITFPVKDMVTDAKKDVEFENEEARNTTNAEPLSEMDSIIRDECESIFSLPVLAFTHRNLSSDERHRDVFDRAPLGLQLIGHRFREEELLGAMRLILKALS